MIISKIIVLTSILIRGLVELQVLKVPVGV